MFQSPRTGKFESNTVFPVSVFKGGRVRFNPLEQGNSNQIYFSIEGVLLQDKRFNPLEQGNSNQIWLWTEINEDDADYCFNPLEQGNSNQIKFDCSMWLDVRENVSIP